MSTDDRDSAPNAKAPSEDAMRLLGSFAKFVRDHEPELAPKFAALAMRWSVQEGVPLHLLARAMED